ncbi:hypothetical protein [Micromonospora parva]|uniref:hypothetical protein n=1 Tax=Micromonospora parva TaxID=1464048 RepID=UPI003404FEAF
MAEESRISENVASTNSTIEHGGVYNGSGTVVLRRTHVDRNRAIGSSSQGGGIYNNATLNLTESKITDKHLHTGTRRDLQRQRPGHRGPEDGHHRQPAHQLHTQLTASTQPLRLIRRGARYVGCQTGIRSRTASIMTIGPLRDRTPAYGTTSAQPRKAGTPTDGAGRIAATRTAQTYARSVPPTRRAGPPTDDPSVITESDDTNLAASARRGWPTKKRLAAFPQARHFMILCARRDSNP